MVCSIRKRASTHLGGRPFLMPLFDAFSGAFLMLFLVLF
jgi:hypothetical protein